MIYLYFNLVEQFRIYYALVLVLLFWWIKWRPKPIPVPVLVRS